MTIHQVKSCKWLSRTSAMSSSTNKEFDCLYKTQTPLRLLLVRVIAESVRWARFRFLFGLAAFWTKPILVLQQLEVFGFLCLIGSKTWSEEIASVSAVFLHKPQSIFALSFSSLEQKETTTHSIWFVLSTICSIGLNILITLKKPSRTESYRASKRLSISCVLCSQSLCKGVS